MMRRREKAVKRGAPVVLHWWVVSGDWWVVNQDSEFLVFYFFLWVFCFFGCWFCSSGDGLEGEMRDWKKNRLNSIFRWVFILFYPNTYPYGTHTYPLRTHTYPYFWNFNFALWYALGTFVPVWYAYPYPWRTRCWYSAKNAVPVHPS